MRLVRVCQLVIVGLLAFGAGLFVAAQGVHFLQVAGTIASVDPERRVVTVASGTTWRHPIRTATAFVVASESSVSDLGGQPLQLADLKPGDQIEVAYVVERGKNVAQALLLQGWRRVMPKPGETPVRGIETAPLEEPLSSMSSPR